MLRMCSLYVSTVLDLCFNRACGMFLPLSRFVSTVHEGCFDRRSRFDLTVREVSLNRACGMFRTSLEVCFSGARGMF